MFWCSSPSYLVLCVAVSLSTFYLDEVLERVGLLHESVLFWGDTLGLGGFFNAPQTPKRPPNPKTVRIGDRCRDS